MTDEIKEYANPGSVVQLNGSQQRGTVLHWEAQLRVDQRDFMETHYPIGPIGSPIGSQATKFWPMAGISVITQAPAQPRPDDLINDRVRF